MTESDKRPMEEQSADYQDEFIMREDETLAGILAKFDEQNAETIRLIETVDLGAAVPSAARAMVPQGRPGLVGAVGAVPHDRGIGAACRTGRHHPRKHRRGNSLRIAGGTRGLGADAMADAVGQGTGKKLGMQTRSGTAVCGEVELYYKDLGDLAAPPVL